MNLTLRAGEKLYLNGGVIRVDRKVTIELLNDVTFLLQSHVLQADEATTPLRQIYFAVQVLLMDPVAASYAIGLAEKLLGAAAQAYATPAIVAGLRSIDELLRRRRYFEALKALRSLYPLEAQEMSPSLAKDRSHAA